MATIATAPTLQAVLQATNAFLQTCPPDSHATRGNILAHMKSLCLPHAVAVVDNVDPPAAMPFRFSLATVGHKADFAAPIARAANGIVIEFAPGADGRIRAAALTAPPPNFNEKFKPDAVRAALATGSYDVFTVADGTLVTLYYWHGAWRMATRKCCQINSMVWRGYTYLHVFEDVLTRAGLSWATFNTAHTYTVGFCHPAFHPFAQPADFTEAEQRHQPPHQWRTGIWMVATSDPEPTGIAPQPTSDIRDFDLMASGNAAALEAWKANPSVQHLGYILRGRGDTSDILLPSTLFSAIHSAMYCLDARLPPGKLATLHEYHRDLNFALLFAYVNSNTRGYLQLFPQFDARVREIGLAIAMAARMICEPAARRESHVAHPIYLRMAAVLGNQYLFGGKLCERKTVVNLLCNVAYADIYYEELFREKAAPTYKWAPRTLGDYVAAAAAATPVAAAPEMPIIKMQKPNIPEPVRKPAASPRKPAAKSAAKPGGSHSKTYVKKST